jgi:hypothetical protein
MAVVAVAEEVAVGDTTTITVVGGMETTDKKGAFEP